MPGFILHLTAAKILLNKYNLPVDENAFYIGNLLPDTVEDKSKSHFRSEKYFDRMIQSPQLQLFLDKYGSLLNDSSVLGYYYHLYIDRKFFTEFCPRNFKYLNVELQDEGEQKKVVWAHVYKTDEIVPVGRFLSEDYYYGDFTRMNTWLKEKYHLPFELDSKVKNPGIEEVIYPDIEKILRQLKSYEAVRADEAENLKVFHLEEVIAFLENAAAEWYGRNLRYVDERK